MGKYLRSTLFSVAVAAGTAWSPALAEEIGLRPFGQLALTYELDGLRVALEDGGDGGFDFDLQPFGDDFGTWTLVTDGGLTVGGRIDFDTFGIDEPERDGETTAAALRFLFEDPSDRFGVTGGIGYWKDEWDDQTRLDAAVFWRPWPQFEVQLGVPLPAIDRIVTPAPTVRADAVLMGGFGQFFQSRIGAEMRFRDEPVPGAALFYSRNRMVFGASVHQFPADDFRDEEFMWDAALRYAGSPAFSFAVGLEGGDAFDEPTLRAAISGSIDRRFHYLVSGFREDGFGGAFTGIYGQGAWQVTPRLQAGLAFRAEDAPWDSRQGWGGFVHYDILRPDEADSLPDTRVGVTGSFADNDGEKVMNFGLRVSF